MRRVFVIECFSRKPLLKRRQYYFRMKVSNNAETVMQSEGYNNRADRNQMAESIAARMGCMLIDLDERP